MNTQEDNDEQPTTAGNNDTNPAGDPGSTPGSAEGDEETVDESIRQHEQKGDQ